jgi:hypothetical protein
MVAGVMEEFENEICVYNIWDILKIWNWHFLALDICNFPFISSFLDLQCVDFPLTEPGPQTDLHWVTVDAVRDAAKKLSREVDQWRFQPAEVDLGRARDLVPC